MCVVVDDNDDDVEVGVVGGCDEESATRLWRRSDASRLFANRVVSAQTHSSHSSKRYNKYNILCTKNTTYSVQNTKVK